MAALTVDDLRDALADYPGWWPVTIEGIEYSWIEAVVPRGSALNQVLAIIYHESRDDEEYEQ